MSLASRAMTHFLLVHPQLALWATNIAVGFANSLNSFASDQRAIPRPNTPMKITAVKAPTTIQPILRGMIKGSRSAV